MRNFLYLIGEAFTNLRRNVLVVAAAVVAVFVSLTLAFGALVFNELVRTTTLQWQAGNHMIIFLHDIGGAAAHDEMLERVGGFEEVERVFYVDKNDAFEEYTQMFARGSPGMLEIVDRTDLPASIRVELSDLSQYQAVQLRLVGDPLVRRISIVSEGIERLLNLTGVLSAIGVGLVLVLGSASVVLIANTIRMAIYARREEISIMKLVGAGNWFIRVPFLLEGSIEGLLGGGLAVGAVLAGHQFLGQLPSDSLIQFQVSGDFLLRWGVLVLLFGGAAGFLGSALGLRRFLKV